MTESADVFICLYCNQPKTRAVDLSASEDSREHIIPDSIGGCCTITGVCKTCNSTFGSEVESYKGLLSWTMVRLTAARLGITGHSGQPHPALVDERATFKAATSPGRPTMDLTANLRLGYGWMDGFLVPTKGDDGSFVASPEHVERWRVKQQQRFLQQYPQAIIAFQDFEYDISQSPIEFHIQEEYDLIARTLAKIGLCYLSYELGHDRALDPAFGALRTYVHAGRNTDPPIAGITRTDVSLHGELPPLHLLSLLQDGSSLYCVISLFNIAAGLVYLGDGAIPQDRCYRILVIDPVAGVARTWRVPPQLHRQWADNMTLPLPDGPEAASTSTAEHASTEAISTGLPPSTNRIDMISLLQSLTHDGDQRRLFLARLNANAQSGAQVSDGELDALLNPLFQVERNA